MNRIPFPAFCSAAIVAILFFLIPSLTTSNYLLHVLIMVFFYGYLGSCWNIIGGFVGEHSFGHASFVGIAAYASTLLFIHLGLTPWIGMWIGALSSALVGLFLGYLSFRYGLKGPYFLLVTIAFAESIVYIFLNMSAAGGPGGLNIPLMGAAPRFFQFGGKAPYYYIILMMLVMIIVITYMIRRSRMGYYFVAIRENDVAAEAVGVNVTRYKLWSIVLSAFFSGLGGAFYAQYILFIDPPSVLGIALSIEIVIYVIVGGEGKILGPILGAFFLFPLGEITRNIFAGQTGGIHLMIYGAILVASTMLMPEGIAGKLSKISLWLKQR